MKFVFILLIFAVNFSWADIPPTPKASEGKDVAAYIIPEGHPAKKGLDQIFKGKQPTASYEAMREAGFSFQEPSDKRKLICAKHRKLKGYLVKTFVDPQGMRHEQISWTSRIEGARQIKKSIDKQGFGKIMKVPKKWIYPLPPDAARINKFLLIVEDMRILDPESNAQAYLLEMTKAKLNALYIILTENLLIDSVFIDNIPFCKDGRIAFIDTEHYNNTAKRLRLERLTKRFNPSMATHWIALISNYQPKGVQE